MAKIGSIAASITAGLTILASLFDGPALAATRCTQWDLSGLRIRQSNFVVDFSLQQSGNSLQGSGRWEDVEVKDGILVGHIIPFSEGPVDGTVNGNEIELTAFWADGTVGAYSGTIGPTGRVEGTTYDKRNSGSRASWHSQDRLTCLASASDEPAPTAPPLPVKILGKKKIPPPPATEIDNTGVIDKTVLIPSSTGETNATCISGFVWRVARPEDLVCVTPKARERTAKENRRAAKYRDPEGAYGPNSCIEGYVWREAFEGDSVCVTPEIRDQVREENSLGPSRRAGG